MDKNTLVIAISQSETDTIAALKEAKNTEKTLTTAT